MKIYMPSRILDRHVGGNTTYARRLAQGLRERGEQVLPMPSHSRAPVTALLETGFGLRCGHADELLHYVADTGPLLRTRRPSVVTVHGVASRWISTARNPRQERIWRSRVSRAIASTDAVITVSESSADDVAEVFGLDRSQITAIPHGIDVEQFSSPAVMSEEVRCRLPEHFVLYLGNLEPRKNVVNLIRAFESPVVKQLGVPLVIAGKPAWNFAEILEEIERATNVVALGFVSDSDRVAMMQECSLFAFPSLYEGFGFPVLEAMAAGAAVITTDRGSLKEIAGPAVLFDDVDEGSIREGIIQALQDAQLLESARVAGLEWARRFSWDRSIDSHVNVYRRVLAA